MPLEIGYLPGLCAEELLSLCATVCEDGVHSGDKYVWMSAVTVWHREVSLLSVSGVYLSTPILLQFVLLLHVILPGMFCWLWGCSSFKFCVGYNSILRTCVEGSSCFHFYLHEHIALALGVHSVVYL